MTDGETAIVGESIVHVVTAARRTPQGSEVYYHLTRDEQEAGCDACRDGSCVQRVEFSDDWYGGRVVTHGVHKDFS